jgi:hypothetical protein
MPSQLHEALLQLFRNRPPLAPELLRDALGVALPAYTEVRIESADLGDLRPVELRADLVVLLCDDTPVLGIVVEAQLRRDRRKHFTWPAYVAGLRARIHCPVCLLVVTTDDRVARWAAEPIDLGGGNRFTPLVLGPAGVPFIDDAAIARSDPELAVLSAMAHGRDADPEAALRVAVAALTASAGLDPERSRLYFDLVAASLGDAARKAFGEMDPAKYEYQSEFARHYIALGRSEGRSEGEADGKVAGKVEGKVELLVRLLTRRFGPLPAAVSERLAATSPAELDRCAERVLDATSIDDVFGDR